MIVKPFRGLRPRPELAARVPSPPYDVLSSAEARELADGDPYSFLHVVKPEIDVDPDVDPHDPRVYAKARENLDAMRDRGWLVRDPRPAFYVYRLVAGDHRQTGVVGVCAASDYEQGRIKRHEHTRSDKESDRTHHADALSAHPGPLFLAYRGHDGLDAVVAEATGRQADVDFIATDGIGHALWRIDDPHVVTRIETAFSELPSTYIADGHHRAAAYARLAARRRAQARTDLSGREPFQFFLAVHFPAAQLRILDYNRVVRDLAGLTPNEMIERIGAQGFELRRDHRERRPQGPHAFGIYVAGTWWQAVARPGIVDEADPVRRLDVSILADRILAPVLGVGDPRTDRRIDFVGGSRGVEELERRVDSGEFAIAFALHPTRLEDVMDVADAGLVMPPKSTWFEPKLRSGMVVHLLDDDGL